jgi:hypothetical protein
MLTAEQINTIHRLHFAERWSMRKIARHLHLGRRTISQYLATPARTPAPRQRASKLDPFKATIAELLEQDAKASAVVIDTTAPLAGLRWRSEHSERALALGTPQHR